MANTNYIRTLTEFEQIDQRFANGQLSSVIEYIDKLKFPVNITTSDDGYIPEKPEVERNALFQNSGIFLDSGDGRVSKGLRGLELLSKLCKGVPSANLFLFNNVIYYSNARSVKIATRDQLIDIVLANLGLTVIIQNANKIAPSEVDSFKNLCYSIGYEVKSGIFRQEQYKSTVLISAKKLTVAASRSQAGVNFNDN